MAGREPRKLWMMQVARQLERPDGMAPQRIYPPPPAVADLVALALAVAARQVFAGHQRAFSAMRLVSPFFVQPPHLPLILGLSQAPAPLPSWAQQAASPGSSPFCPFPCPPFSSFDPCRPCHPCSSSCPATCSSFDPSCDLCSATDVCFVSPSETSPSSLRDPVSVTWNLTRSWIVSGT